MENEQEQLSQFILNLRSLAYIEDKRFNNCTFHQMTKQPYNYLIKFTNICTVEQLNFYLSIAKLGPPMLPIQFINQEEQSRITNMMNYIHMNNSNPKLSKRTFFIQYYNFTLEELINLMQNKKIIITQCQLVYILKSLLLVSKKYYSIYKKQSKAMKSTNVYLTPEKMIKMYPLHFPYEILEEHEQAIFDKTSIFTPRIAQRYTNNSTLHNSYVSTKETVINTTNIDQNSHHEPYHYFLQNDITDIFIILLQLLTQKHKKYYYDEKRQTIIQDQINMELQISQNFKIVSNSFKHMMILVLKERKIRDYWALESYIQQMIKKNEIVIVKSLRLYTYQQQKKPREQEQIRKLQRYAIFKSISRRLTPSKLQISTKRP